MPIPPNPGDPDFFAKLAISDRELRVHGVKKKDAATLATLIQAQLKAPTEDALDAMVTGQDATIVVDRWTRSEAKAEAVAGEALGLALKLRGDAAWAPLTRETFAELYDRSLDALPAPEGTLGGFVAEALSHAREMPEWQRLRDRCEGDSFLSGLGAHTLLEALNVTLPESPTSDPDILEEMARVEPTKERQEEAQRARALMDQAMSNLTGSRGPVRTAVRHGVKRANDAIDEVMSDARAFGLGTGLGEVDPKDLREVAKAVRANPKLGEIARLAGRLRVHASRVRKTKVNHIPEEVVEVTTGSDISRLTASELGALADPMLELGLMQRIHDGAASIHKMRGNEAAAKGPVIFCLDESGSMKGERDTYCKAVALVMAEIAIAGKRDFALVHFAGSVGRTDHFRASDGLVMAKLAEALAYFQGGGTDIGRAMSHAHSLIQGPQYGKADVVVVTDGCSDRVSIANAMASLHADGARVHMVAIETPETSSAADVIRSGDTASFIGCSNDSELDTLMGV
jgi:uncharacterized protein with von Willebrand factor type A (vWA) domain